MVVIAILVPVVVLVLNSTILRENHHTNSAHHTHPRWVSVIVLIVAILFMCGFTFLVIRRGRRTPNSLFAPPLVAGLPRPQRRSTMRNIRRGTPSSDPTQAQVEREVAQTMVRSRRRTLIIFGIFLILELVESVTRRSTPARIFFAAAAVLFASLLVMTLLQLRGARVYLANTPEPPAPQT
ncbi:hypothetical protein [Allobranchiibius sp. CTAmp26]|uniref:hypothetical protein n=1 Tax=Allobranchiibius sp. CTAmp26 TaxID=2815214 RepID=UPI001AA0E3E6|nr:hypothetical protein [Allobranchiibius sp. CTAmp26]MBO1756895.1 hypothetical protein [Allobranchiibius sp. CTAmp26]